MASEGSSAAFVEGQQGSGNPPRTLYCHQCHLRTTMVNPDDVTCSECGSGFVEEVSAAELNNEPDPFDVYDEYEDNPEFYGGGLNLMEQLGQIMMEQQQPGVRPRGGGGRRGGRRGLQVHSSHQNQFHPGDQFLNSLLSNLIGDQPGVIHIATSGGGPGGAGVPMMPFYGNPGDYAWGRGGFDAIVTQLLNQMDGAGPPPLTPDGIKQIPTIKILQTHIDEKLQCSVCWDDFKLEEDVRQLTCEHIFHEGCIVPWLELHATCPVCRKPQGDAADESTSSEPSSSNMASNSEGAVGGFLMQQRPVTGPSTVAAPETAASLGNTISTVLNQFFGVPSPTSTVSASSSTTSSNSGSSAGHSAAAPAAAATVPSASNVASSSTRHTGDDTRGGSGQGTRTFQDDMDLE